MNKLERDFKSWIKWNASCLFLMKPLTGMNITHAKEFGLTNTFLKDEESKYDGDFLFMLLKPANFDFLEILIQNQNRDNPNFVDDYDYSGGWVVLVYKIPEIWKDDFEKFKKGEYSKMSEGFKKHHDFKATINYIQENTIQYMVFYKDEQFKADTEAFFDVVFNKDDELWEIPLEKKETLNIEEIRKKEEGE